MSRFFFLYSFTETVCAAFADKLALIFDQAFVTAADDAVGLVFFQNYAVALYKNFNSVLLSQGKGSSDFDGENDTTQLVELAYNTGGFHFPSLLN